MDQSPLEVTGGSSEVCCAWSDRSEGMLQGLMVGDGYKRRLLNVKGKFYLFIGNINSFINWPRKIWSQLIYLSVKCETYLSLYAPLPSLKRLIRFEGGINVIINYDGMIEYL